MELAEYAYTMKVTEKCDVYSFGVVLLELLTRQKPVRPLDEGGDLVSWVRQAVRAGAELADIFDAGLLNTDEASSIMEEMILVFNIALFCTAALPADRPSMHDVVYMLLEVKKNPRDARFTGIYLNKCS
jgi:serine/threonine protein kinase